MTLRVALAQLDVVVGDVDGNADRILDAWRRADEAGARLVVTSELAVTGYPPEDLLLKPDVLQAERDALRRIAAEGRYDRSAARLLVRRVRVRWTQCAPSSHWRVKARARPEDIKKS